MIRAGFYIDGFNAYHSIHNLRANHLKWLDWASLARQFVPSRDEEVVAVCICTATRTDNLEKQLRHRAYLKALNWSGVEVLQGHFLDEPKSCRSCKNTWVSPVEKQGDVNLSISAIRDCYRNIVDHVYIVTADGDQAATVRFIRSEFPDKIVTSLVIEGQRHNHAILQFANDSRVIRKSQLEANLFPKFINGQNAILRPVAYDPPGEL